MLKQIVIRCNAGHNVGYGHLSRCLSLALALKEQDAVVHFVLGSDGGLSRIHGRGFSASILTENTNEEFLEYIKTAHPDVLVLDAKPAYSLEVVKNIKNYVKRIVVIDNIEPQVYAADMVFLPPTPAVMAFDWSKFQGEKFIGLEWMLLGDSFVPCMPCPPRTPRRLLMTMGGSDPWGYTIQYAPLVSEICQKNNFDLGIVIGPGFRVRQKHLDFCASLPQVRKVFDAPQNMTDVYDWCDMAMTVFCVSAYELAACQKPALYLCPTQDYKDHASIFEMANVGRSWNFSLKSLSEKLVSLCSEVNFNELKSDGKSAERIAKQIVLRK